MPIGDLESQGGAGGSGNVTFSAEDLLRAAKMLEHNLEAFTGAGSLADLEGRGPLTAQQLGDWDAGRALADATGQAHRQILRLYQEFLDEYRAVVAALRATARAYGEGERAARSAVTQIRFGGPAAEQAQDGRDEVVG